jgi:hypothetical protein
MHTSPWFICRQLLFCLFFVVAWLAVCTGLAQSATAATLTLDRSSIAFGDVVLGQTTTLSCTLSNSGPGSVTVSKAVSNNVAYSLTGRAFPLSLGSGKSATVTIKFRPKAGGHMIGTIVFSSNASNPKASVSLSGWGVAGRIAASLPSVNLGSVAVGNTATLAETLTNIGQAPVLLSSAHTTGSAFGRTGISPPLTLAPAARVTFKVSFKPTVGGTVRGSLTVISNASNPTVSIPLSGTGRAGTLTLNRSSIGFGNVVLGQTRSLFCTLSNSGPRSVTVSKIIYSTNGAYSVTGPAFPLSLGSGKSVTVTIKFAPKAVGRKTEAITFSSNASNPTVSVSLSGWGVQGKIAASLPTVNLGSVKVGSTATLAETLTNIGTASVTLSSANTTGSAFGRTGISPPLTLAPAQRVTFNVFFKPTVSGTVSGSLAVISNASNPTVSIPLSGTGTAAGTLTVSPTSANLGSVTVGTSKTMAASLSAVGSSVVISTATTTSSEFTLSGATFPMTVSAGKSVSLTVKFVPQSSGAASGKLSFVSNASNSTTVEALTGTGVAASQHHVNLSWAASSSSVAGYDIYRGTHTGGPYSKVDSLDSATSFSDSSVLAGQTYYYVVTGVNSKGTESAYSSEAKAVIPSP